MESKISIVIPAYNEESNIVFLLEKLIDQLKVYPGLEIIVVDDGSSDNTSGAVSSFIPHNPDVKLITLSGNFGHQNALKAGFDHATGDAVICMDADLQHPVELIPEMIKQWKNGFDIVYTVRKKEVGMSWFKKLSSAFFYGIMNTLSDIKLPHGAADFRLVSRQVADILKNDLSEYHLFYRGLTSWIGFRKNSLEYTPDPRRKGKTKYSLRKMIGLSLNGVTSFSIKPLRSAIFLGLLISAFAFFYAIYALYIVFFTERAILGWTSVIISILFIGGIQMIILGIIGEYVGKTYFEVKKRPHYIIREKSF